MKNLKRLKDWYAGLMKEQKSSVHVTVGVMLFELGLFIWSLTQGWVWTALLVLAFLILITISTVHMVKSFNRLNRTLRKNREQLENWFKDFGID